MRTIILLLCLSISAFCWGRESEEPIKFQEQLFSKLELQYQEGKDTSYKADIIAVELIGEYDEGKTYKTYKLLWTGSTIRDARKLLKDKDSVPVSLKGFPAESLRWPGIVVTEVMPPEV